MRISDEILALVIGLIASITVELGILSIVWLGWRWLIPHIFPGGQENIIRPSYWLFVGSFMLLNVISRLVFGRK